MFRNILTGAAALALITGANAQQSQMTVHKATTPQFAGVYHPSTGLVKTNGLSARFGPETIYNNTTLTGYYSVPGVDQEWIDAGQLADRNAASGGADQVNGMLFTYCSAAPNTVDLTISVYDDLGGTCVVPNGWPANDCQYGVAGLPGGTNGALSCWNVQLELSGVECDLMTDTANNRLFGWGQTWNDGATGPWIADGGLGNVDLFKWMDTLAPNANAADQGCYVFVSARHAGFAMAFNGHPEETFGYSSAAGLGADDSLVLNMDASAQVGSTVNISVYDNPFAGTTVASNWFVGRTPVDVSLMGPFGIDAHLLVNYSTKRYESISATGVHTLTVPAAAGGLMWYSQAGTVSGGSPTAMSNALIHNVL